MHHEHGPPVGVLLRLLCRGRGGKESVDHLLLAAWVGVGKWGRSLHAAAGTAGELPRRGWGALNDRRDLIEGHGEHVVEDNASCSAGPRASSTTSSASPTESASSTSYSGSTPSSGLTIGSGTCGPNGSSCRELRDVRVFRHTRATIVVSHPRGLSMPRPVGFADSEPGVLDRVVGLAQRAEHPIGDGSQVGALLLETFRHEVVLVHRSHRLVAPCHRDRPTKSIGCDHRARRAAWQPSSSKHAG
jgi:hypothetical protein